MPADVEEGAKLVLAIADDDEGHVADGRREERGGFGHVAQVAHVLPRVAKYPLALELEDCRIGVPAPRQRPHVDRAHGWNASCVREKSCGPLARAARDF